MSENDWMEKLITKLNNIERRGFYVERHFHLGGRLWRVGNTLYVNRMDDMGYLVASKEERELFKQLYEEFNK